jgi:ribonuclease HII
MAALTPTLAIERAMFRAGCRRLAALDEVGRGALAGPVSVGAVVIDATVRTPPRGLRDSKLLAPAARERLMTPIGAWVVSWAVGHASSQEIDQIGIMAALTLAAHRALAGLDGPVDAVLLDGIVDYVSAGHAVIPAPTVTTRAKADRDCASVAAASVLAKVTRDAMMTALDRDYPHYHWAQNKGYGTGSHTDALAAYGPCERHRRSWRLPDRVLEESAFDA